MKTEDKTKCFNCGKKVSLLGFECKCDSVFCKNCRMPEKHQCTFDFKI